MLGNCPSLKSEVGGLLVPLFPNHITLYNVLKASVSHLWNGGASSILVIK